MRLIDLIGDLHKVYGRCRFDVKVMAQGLGARYQIKNVYLDEDGVVEIEFEEMPSDE